MHCLKKNKFSFKRLSGIASTCFLMLFPTTSYSDSSVTTQAISTYIRGMAGETTLVDETGPLRCSRAPEYSINSQADEDFENVCDADYNTGETLHLSYSASPGFHFSNFLVWPYAQITNANGRVSDVQLKTLSVCQWQPSNCAFKIPKFGNDRFSGSPVPVTRIEIIPYQVGDYDAVTFKRKSPNSVIKIESQPGSCYQGRIFSYTYSGGTDLSRTITVPGDCWYTATLTPDPINRPFRSLNIIGEWITVLSRTRLSFEFHANDNHPILSEE
jgi:hypothetical protein